MVKKKNEIADGYKVTDSSPYTVTFNGKEIGCCLHSWDVDGIINKHISCEGKPWMMVYIKRILIAMMVTPVLMLAYHKGLSEYIEWLWPTATIASAATTGVISLISAFASGIYIAIHWKA